MKKTFKKILVITLILILTILLLPSCKDKTDEPVPEIMPYGVYYFISYNYIDSVGGGEANWYITPNTKNRIDRVNKAMEYVGYYFVFTPSKIVFGGSIEDQTDHQFTYKKAVGPGISYTGSLLINPDNLNEDSKNYFVLDFDFYYNKSGNSTYKFFLCSKTDNLKLRYTNYSNREVPDFVFDGTPYGDTEILIRNPINYNDYI